MNFQFLHSRYTEPRTKARNLAEHCSKYVIQKEEFSDLELLTSGNELVVSGATYQGRPVVLKRWHGALAEDGERVRFAKVGAHFL